MAAYAAAVANPGQIGVIATPTSSTIYVEEKYDFQAKITYITISFLFEIIL